MPTLDLQAKRIVLNEMLLNAMQLNAVIDYTEYSTKYQKGFKMFSVFLDEEIIKRILFTTEIVKFDLCFFEDFSIIRESGSAIAVSQ